MGLRASIEVRRGDLEVVVDLTVDDDRRLALLGPNGAGKTTVVEALAGLVPAATARIELDGERIDHLPPERRRIGLCFQDDLLFPRLSALENVAFPLRARPPTLSGGERKKVALARALIADPRLLLLDEPLATVDVSARADLRTSIRDATESFAGATVLVAHDPLDALTLADDVIVLERGRVTQTGTPDEIRRAPRSGYAADLVGVNLFEGTIARLPDGAGRLRTANGSIDVAPLDPVPDGTPTLATLRPSDVALHTHPPEGSPRNVVRGRVVEIAIEGDRARVRIDAAPPLMAEITVGSVRRLGIDPGSEVWASFKAVEVSLHPNEVQAREAAPGTLER